MSMVMLFMILLKKSYSIDFKPIFILLKQILFCFETLENDFKNDLISSVIKKLKSSGVHKFYGSPHVIWLLINVAEALIVYVMLVAQEQDFSWQRLDAVTLKSDDFVYEKSKTKWYRDLTDGEIACYLSHRKAWRQAIDSKADYLVVLEDDLIVQSPLKR